MASFAAPDLDAALETAMLESAAGQIRAHARINAANAATAQKAVKIVRTFVTNAADKDDPKYRQIRLANRVVQAKVMPVPGALELLRAAGFARAGGMGAGSGEAMLVLGGDAGAAPTDAAAARLRAARATADALLAEYEAQLERQRQAAAAGGAGGGGGGGGGATDDGAMRGCHVWFGNAAAMQVAAGAVRSQASGTPLAVTFRNNTREYLEVQWVAFDGMTQPVGALVPGGTMDQRTFASHPFAFVARGGAAFMLYVPLARPPMHAGALTAADAVAFGDRVVTLEGSMDAPRANCRFLTTTAGAAGAARSGGGGGGGGGSPNRGLRAKGQGKNQTPWDIRCCKCREYIFRGRSYGATGLRCATCRTATDAAGRLGHCADWFVLCSQCFTAGGGMGGAGHGHPQAHAYEILPLPGRHGGGSGWGKPAPPPPPVGSRPRRGPWG